MIAVAGLVVAALRLLGLTQTPGARGNPQEAHHETHPRHHPPLCEFGTSIHGGDGPSHPLTIVMDDRETALAFQARDSSAENAMLQILGAWQRLLRVGVAQVHVFYDLTGCDAPRRFDRCVFLATAMTRGLEPPIVTFY